MSYEHKFSRNPSMKDGIHILRERGNIPVKTILDVGVQFGTPGLITAFPNTAQVLFEPVDLYHSGIIENYRDLDYQLFPIALCDVDQDAWILNQSMDDSGEITHAQVSMQPAENSDVAHVLSEKPVRAARLDTITAEQSFAKPYLLKIDVDGAELAILKGATETLCHTSLVILEVTLERLAGNTFLERTQFMIEAGFVLMDIVDLAYYDSILYKVDMLFIHADYAKGNTYFLPFEHKEFVLDKHKWVALKGDEAALQKTISELRERVATLSEANQRLRDARDKSR